VQVSAKSTDEEVRTVLRGFEYVRANELDGQDDDDDDDDDGGGDNGGGGGGDSVNCIPSDWT
jgi:hypothetical protein